MPRNVKNLRIYISNLSYVVFLSVKTWIFLLALLTPVFESDCPFMCAVQFFRFENLDESNKTTEK